MQAKALKVHAVKEVVWPRFQGLTRRGRLRQLERQRPQRRPQGDWGHCWELQRGWDWLQS